jgi:hypothetical protein
LEGPNKASILNRGTFGRNKVYEGDIDKEAMEGL